MKIAYLSTFYPYRGGIAQFNASLMRELSRDNECKAYTFTRQYPNLLFPGSTQMVEANDNAQAIESIRLLDTINPLSYITTSRIIRKFKPDLLLTKFWMPFFAPSLGSVARNIRKIGTKAFAILDNVIPHEKRIGDLALVKYFLNSNDAFVVMTESVKNDLLDLKPDAKYILTPHPLYDHFGEKLTKETARQILGIESKQKVLLFFGFIRSYKGLDLLLEAMTKLSNDYLLIIAGEVYGSFNEYEDYIKRNDLNNKVKLFIRYISDEEVKLFFCSSDVCVLPYKSGTQSGIIGISYHFDLPVIATDVGGLAEMINPYRTGIVVGEPKVENIIFGIEQYFQGETSQIYTKNIRKYKEIANWKSLAFNIIRFYENI